MSVEEQLRAYGRTIEQRRVPIVAQDVVDDTVVFDPISDGRAGRPRSRWVLPAAAAVMLVAATVGLFAFGRGDGEPSPIISPPTSPKSPPTTVPLTTPATTTVTETVPSTAVPSESIVPPVSTEPGEIESASTEVPAELPRPVSGQTQRSLVGDIAWAQLEGGATSVPAGPFVGVDGSYLGGVDDGRTWRSADGVEWERVDLGGDGIDDQAVFGEIGFAGETWARTNDGLARWVGETFVPVALPESRIVGLGGLSVSGPLVGAPVVLGDQLVVPVHWLLQMPWRDLFGEGARAEWTGDPQTIRILDASRIEEYSSDDPLPVLAVLSATFIDGEPGRFEFRDVSSNELVTTVEAVPGVDPAELLPRLIDGEYREILIGDADGFEIVEPPGGWGVPGSWVGDLVPIDGGLLGMARSGYRTVTFDGGLGADAWEVWTSTDARSWVRLDLPTPSGSIIDIVDLASDGSTALVTINSRLTAESEQDVESWITRDGRRWQTSDAGSLSRYSGISVRPAEFGWLVDSYDGDVAVSPDGRRWQAVRFLQPHDVGAAGSWVVGRTIFLFRSPSDSARSLWIGHVAEN